VCDDNSFGHVIKEPHFEMGKVKQIDLSLYLGMKKLAPYISDVNPNDMKIDRKIKKIC
jgi:hypothetical protein